MHHIEERFLQGVILQALALLCSARESKERL